ncbi:MAG: histidinol dehydrogenase [Terriglobales bacterium]
MNSSPVRILPATAATARALRAASRRDQNQARRVAARIVASVRRGGGPALELWRQRLERPAPAGPLLPLAVPRAELARAWRRLPPPLQAALRQAKAHIRQMAEWQRPVEWRRQMLPGVLVGQIVRPLESVGCYVPAGRHPLPSTLLMTVVPARAAGVARIAVACPQPGDAVLGAAWLAGAGEVYRMGGAQAIAALAYGAGPVRAVEKIVGPGNRYVTAAKELVQSDCAIDFPAGPTEVLWLADADARLEFAAADLIAQAEHDPDAAAWLVVLSRRQAAAAAAAIARQLAAAPNPIARRALRRRGAILVARGKAEALAAANLLAAEHITLPAAWLPQLQAAGSVFLGAFAPQAVGDYLSGANHVLPTGGGPRRRGGLSIMDFVKIATVQQLSRPGLARLAPGIITLARAEGLEAHARSVELRLPASARRRP